MSDVGSRVRLIRWPYGGDLMKEGMRGTIVRESIRNVVVQWDGLTYEMGMSQEEVALVFD